MSDAPATKPARLTSLDAYRGFVMFLMAAEALHLPRLAAQFKDNPIWQTIGYHTSHVEWTGCSLHDLIQPSFSFMVGVALPYSIASRSAKGQSFGRMLFHALVRSFILCYLGIFLRSVGGRQANFTFEDTLTQIGLGYPFLFLLGFVSARIQWAAVILILAGYWGAFVAYPAPSADFDYPRVRVSADWPYHEDGLAAHFNKNANLASRFDQWFLNLFPREKEFVANGGGYATLSFLPTLGTMIFGLIAGGLLRSDRTALRKLALLVVAGLVGLGIGIALDYYGVCPVVKRIWTPSWTIYSAGWTSLLLAGFYAVIDIAGFRRWAFPLVVIGMNSITMYVLVHLVDGFIISSIKTHFGQEIFLKFGEQYESLLAGGAVVLVLWLFLFWFYRRGIFIRI